MKILEQIAVFGGTVTCKRLTEIHNISLATISHHLKELELASLIEIMQRGRNATLLLRPETLCAYLNEFSSWKRR
jgi:uncharacterized membrane protein